jgi:two-component system, cell cycle sensor histidine kinase and response regulator CckA
MLAKGQVFLDNLGSAVRLAGIVMDVTERKRAEEQCLRLASIVESCEDAIFSKNLDGTIVNWNSGAERLFGYTAEEIVGKPVSILLPPEHLHEFPKILERMQSGACLKHYEVTRKRKDGGRVEVSVTISPIKDSEGILVGTSTIAHDITQRKQAEEALRISQQRLELAQEAGGIATWDWDIVADQKHCSKEFWRLYGLSERDLPPLPEEWLQWVHPEDRARVSEERNRALDDTGYFNTEFRVVWPDGTVHWLLGKGEVLRDSNGKPIRMLGVNMDISERKYAEQALRESEERFRNMADTAPVMIWVSGSDKLCTFFNKRWLEFTGRTLKQELGNGWADGVHPEDLHRCLGIYHSSFDSRHAFQMEYRLRGADGEYRWILESGTPVHRGGEFVGFIGSCIDITEQKLIEERMRASESRLLKAQRLAKVGSWERDLAAERILWSDEMHRIFGTPGSAPSNFPTFLNCVHSEDRERIMEADREILSTNALVDTEYRIIRPNGEIRFLRSIVEAIRNDEGAPVRIVGVTQDITDVKRAQQEDFVRQKLESLGTLAGGIAHDFNNLLGGVMAQAELGLEEYQAGASPEQELKRIRDGAIRGSEIVRQLMIYAGKESEAVGLVDVSQVARGMVELLKVSISKHAALITDFGVDLPAVRGSTGEIQQIVMNLVTNASEALADRDGVIRVTTRRINVDRADAISKGIAEGDYVELEVADTGRGMSLETQARVFDPFFTTKSQGHGLGLGVVRGIVRGLGGAIHLASELGKGSTFEIFLRSTGITTGTSDPLRPAGDPSPAPVATILVVEDDDALRVALAQILRRRGFETLDAANGADAINFLRANSIKIDMMLLDMTIPGPSSRDVAAVAAEARRSLKVVLTSAYDEKLVRTTVGATQACGFVRKPFQVDELVHTLRSALSARGTTG